MKLTNKIHILQIDFEIALSPEKKLARFVNVLLIIGKKITLIDTGVKGSELKIADYLLSIGRDIKEVEQIILSHAHPDHIGSAAKIKELTACKVLAHRAEQNWIEHIEVQNAERPVPGFLNLVDTSVAVDEFINDGDKICIDENLNLKFFHTPGHSTGSLSVLFVEDDILFTADAIPLKNDIPNYGNYRELRKSLEQIKSLTDNCNMLLSSWTTVINDKQKMLELIDDGEEYMNKLNDAVTKNYTVSLVGLDNCKATVSELGLPPFLVIPIVDKAFRSHFQKN